MKIYIAVFCLVLSISVVSAQNGFTPKNDIPVYQGNKTLKYPWAGGLNNPQFAAVDLNGDGIDDLVVFNRGYYDGGQQVLTFINGGTPNQVDYTYAPEYAYDLPDMRHWMLSDDYNCDGVPDFVTWEQPALMVQYNGTRGSNGRLSFTRMGYYSYTTETGNTTNIFISAIDIPAVVDVNDDGDFDVLTFSPVGFRLEYFENLSVENGATCSDTVGFDIRSYCWGDFDETGITRSVVLNDPCQSPNTPKWDEIEDGSNRHVGSAIMAFDENGDGIKEVLLGDVSFDNMVRLFMGGNLDSAVALSQDTLFPAYDRPISVPIFPAAFYSDVNNDGRKDLLVGANTPKKGFNHNCSWYYKDGGTGVNVEFEFQTDSFLVGDMIDVGEGAYPAFVDVNGDGLQDMLVGNNGYFLTANSSLAGLALFINVGTVSAPAFRLIDKDYLGLSTFLTGSAKLQTIAPVFADMNGDGALDMIFGDHVGNLHYYRNTAAPGDSMRLVIAASPLASIDVGNFAKPEVYDVNGDGLPDLIVGRQLGNLFYFENNGTTGSPSFSSVPTNANFGEINVKPNLIYGESTPRVVFLAHNSQPYLLVGNILGNLSAYELDASKRYSGAFNRIDSVYSSIDVGEYAHLTIADIDNDGKFEMAVGSLRGGVQFFKETDFPNSITEVAAVPLSIKAYPNPSAGNWSIELANLALGQPINITVYDVLGAQVYTDVQMPTGITQVLPLQLSVSSGVYICHIQQGGNTTVLRLLAH